MIRFLTLYFVLSSFILSGQSTLTKGEVYDYNIGDEFQYSIDNYPGTMVERYIVLDKQFSQTNDTIFYTMSESNYSNGPDGSGGTAHYFSEDTINLYVTNLSDPITTFGDSTEIYDIYEDSTYFYYPDTIIEYDSDLCNLEVNGWESYPPVFESNHIIHIYGKGVGSVWSYHYDPSSPSPHLIDRKLYYYKKGTLTCGSSVTASIESINLNDSQMKIYPIPASKEVNVELLIDENIVHSRLIDSRGKCRVIDLNKNSGQKHTFDTTHIPDGIYFLHVTTHNNAFKKKVIISH